MNCWLLINLFLVIVKGENILLEYQSTIKSDFVELLPDQNWRFSPGERKAISITFKIKEGFHIQSDEPLDENLIPTELIIFPQDQFIVSEPKFPTPVSFQLKNDPAVMLVFNDKLEIQLPVVITDRIRDSSFLIKGNLKYQACDSVKCYFPRELRFEIPMMVR